MYLGLCGVWFNIFEFGDNLHCLYIPWFTHTDMHQSVGEFNQKQKANEFISLLNIVRNTNIISGNIQILN